VNDPSNKKYFVWPPVFFDFFRKNQKKGDKTLFYFAAGGGEMLVPHPRPASRRRADVSLRDDKGA
jgi:hypothetical protein